jgi:site-specific DNA-methyltransferase (adenine-specific)
VNELRVQIPKRKPQPKPVIHHQDDHVTLWHGNCMHVLRELPDDSVDAIVTDPPYELGFMGKHWDAVGIAYDVNLWAECLRVLKPGGHLAAFGGTRTWHRMVCAIEDAGFEVRDCLSWMYGSGFPKSHDIGKAIDRAAGAEREVVGVIPDRWAGKGSVLQRSTQQPADTCDITTPATPEAATWDGWGTALKPAWEPITLCRKPIRGTVAANVLTHGTGAINVDACRVGTGGQLSWSEPRDMGYHGGSDVIGSQATESAKGRWPANVILDPDAAAILDQQSGETSGTAHVRDPNGTMGYHGGAAGLPGVTSGHADSGGASRFFYTPKADAHERPRVNGVSHPTVKPRELMAWICRLITPPGGVILDPFAGSGTTLEAAIVERFRVIGIEREADYMPLIMQRLTRGIEVTLL